MKNLSSVTFIFLSMLGVAILLMKLADNHTLKKVKEVDISTPVLEEKVSALGQTTKKRVYKILVDPERTILLNDFVNNNSIETTISILRSLNFKSSDPIYLLLDSPGGFIADGMRLLSYMETSPAPIYTVVYGHCGSMCAQIHQRGKQRYMMTYTNLMFHPASNKVEGTFDVLESRINFSVKEMRKLDAQIADRAGMLRDDFNSLLHAEIWLSAEDATKLNFNDKIVAIEFYKNTPFARIRSTGTTKPDSDKGQTTNPLNTDK